MSIWDEAVESAFNNEEEWLIEEVSHDDGKITMYLLTDSVGLHPTCNICGSRLWSFQRGWDNKHHIFYCAHGNVDEELLPLLMVDTIPLVPEGPSLRDGKPFKLVKIESVRI